MPAGPDLGKIKGRQQQAWGAGDFSVIGAGLVPAVLERARERAAAERLPVSFQEGRFNRSGDETLVAPSDYLEVVALRA